MLKIQIKHNINILLKNVNWSCNHKDPKAYTEYSNNMQDV